MKEILKMTNLTKSYYMGGEELKALNNVNLVINEGEFVSVLGPSGSGKTTFMNIVGCLDVPTEGHCTLASKKVEDLSEKELARIRNDEIGFLFHNFQLLPRLSSLQCVVFQMVYA